MQPPDLPTNRPIKHISILGCGWLGLPLGKVLVDNGFQVKGSTTSTAKLSLLANHGIQPFLIDLPTLPVESIFSDFLASEVLLINIPPKVEARGAAFHVEQVQQLVRYLPNSAVRQVIYVSSTSVYPDLNREIDELEPLPQEGSHLTLLRAEMLLQALKPAIGVSTLRCGGLMGYDRMPGKYVAGKKGLTTGDVPVNYVHRDDVVAILLKIIRESHWGNFFNVVAPLHPSRREVYLKNTADFGLEPPQFSETAEQPFKIVNGEKLRRTLPYDFLYPDPLDFYYSR